MKTKLCKDCKNRNLKPICNLYTNTSNYAEQCKDFKEKKQTNVDRIRSMNNEELAYFLCRVKADYQWVEQEYPSEEESEEWEKWLQLEVEE